MSDAATTAKKAPPPRLGDAWEHVGGGRDAALYEQLLKGGDQLISALYRATFGVAAHEDLPTNRLQQQNLGTYIRRLNQKLAPRERVVTGHARRTYRLELISAEG